MLRFAKTAALLALCLSSTAQAFLPASRDSVDQARREIVNLITKVDQLEKLIEQVAVKGRQDLAEQMQARIQETTALQTRLQALVEQQAQEQAKRKEIEQALQTALERAQGALDRAGSAAEEQALLRRGSLELLNQLGQLRRDLQQIEQVRQELAQLRRDKENLAEFFTTQQRELANVRQAQADLRNNLANLQAGVTDVQRSVKDTSALVEERIRRVEPVKVTVDGREFEASPAEVAAFDAADKSAKSGDHKAAVAAFEQFLARYPASGYLASVWYRLGTSQYELGDFKQAQSSFRTVLRDFSRHPRAADSMLGVASAQFDLKEPRATVRKTLEDLIKAYPDATSAVATARERLSKLK